VESKQFHRAPPQSFSRLFFIGECRCCWDNRLNTPNNVFITCVNGMYYWRTVRRESLCWSLPVLRHRLDGRYRSDGLRPRRFYLERVLFGFGKKQREIDEAASIVFSSFRELVGLFVRNFDVDLDVNGGITECQMTLYLPNIGVCELR
jgi:hypothetical protein